MFFTDDPNEAADKALERHFEKSQRPLSLLTFGAIALYKLKLVDFFFASSPIDAYRKALSDIFYGRRDNLDNFLIAHGAEAILAISTYLWWTQYSQAVRSERHLLANLYDKMGIRKRIGSIKGSSLIPLAAYGLTITFLLLMYLIDQLPLYCIVVFALNIIDIWGNSTIRTTLTEDFWKKGFAPPPGDPTREFSLRRADVIEDYWIRRPQLERIGLMMIATCVAFLLCFSKEILGFSTPLAIPYFVVICMILLNGQTMRSWRKKRDRALNQIELEEDIARGKRVD
jgi:hypothetical protein